MKGVDEVQHVYSSYCCFDSLSYFQSIPKIYASLISIFLKVPPNIKSLLFYSACLGDQLEFAEVICFSMYMGDFLPIASVISQNGPK